MRTCAYTGSVSPALKQYKLQSNNVSDRIQLQCTVYTDKNPKFRTRMILRGHQQNEYVFVHQPLGFPKVLLDQAGIHR